MATLKGGYFLKDGTRVPSVTTVISRFKESGALIHWAAGQASEYVLKNLPENPSRADVGRICHAAKNSYRDVRDDAASAGTLAHDAVDAFIHGKEFEWPATSDIVKKAQNAFLSFQEWADQTQLKTTDTEKPLVSEVYKFGGTPDAFTLRGKRAVLDWKTSNSIYIDYLIQVAAYGVLWNENYADDPIVGGYHIVRFDKTHGDFSHFHYDELDKAREAFLLMMKLYEIDKALKERVR